MIIIIRSVCGITESELTKLGHEQAQCLAEEIARKNLGIDAILYSPLSRARDTAFHIAEVIGVPCRQEQQLIEQNFGKIFYSE
ncbi:MAG: histidine phosphatase family protein [Lachnospiraceae bacterium]